MEDEIWKTYSEFDFIQGSNFGNVRMVGHYVKIKNGRRWIPGHVLKQYCDRQGYMRVQFGANGKMVNRLVHRIVAGCFIANPNNWPQLNHKNCIRDDNKVENLEFCTPQYNTDYREKYGVAAKKFVPKKPVIAVNLKAQEVMRFPSKKEASQVLGINAQNINSVIDGKRATIGDYWLTNADENAIDDAKDRLYKIIGDKIKTLKAVDNNDPVNRFIAGCSRYETGTATKSIVAHAYHKEKDQKSLANKPLFVVCIYPSEAFWFESRAMASKQLNISVADIKNTIDGPDRTIGGCYLINDDEDAVEIAKEELPYVITGGLDYLSAGNPDDERAFDFVVDCVNPEFDLRKLKNN